MFVYMMCNAKIDRLRSCQVVKNRHSSGSPETVRMSKMRFWVVFTLFDEIVRKSAGKTL